MKRIKSIQFFRLAGISLLLLACSEPQNQNTNQILNASWNEAEQIFSVNGKASNNTEKITLVDGVNNSAVASANVDTKNSWKIALFNPEIVPCSVRINNLSKAVENAPGNCSNSRFPPVQIQISENQTVPRTLPDSVILEPAENKTIQSGQSLVFSGLSSISGARYQWEFSGAASSVTVQNPGNIVFNKIGSYRVKLTTIDAHGFADPTPAERLITVIPNESQKRALSASGVPVATIATPAQDKNILVGQSLFFAAAAAPAGEAYIYEWDFGGAIPASNLQVPGVVTFNEAGSFFVSLNVIDAAGVRSTLAASRTITVSSAVGNNQAPGGIIREPLADAVITAGDSLNFLGSVIDPDNNGPFTFLWNFNGAAEDSVQLNPGLVVFSVPGVYDVTFIATDGAGLADPNPPTRTITVNSVEPVNTDLPDGVILSPSGDMTIDIGTSIEFAGEGSSAAGNLPLSFNWNFGGAAPDSELESPGAITFNSAGVYLVTFTVTDSAEQNDPAPAQVTIIVEDPNAPNGTITLPMENVAIEAGASLGFSGEGNSPVGADPLLYFWEFAGGTPEQSLEQNPEAIVFGAPGEYEVKLTVVDANGIADPTPAIITVTVSDPGVVVGPAGAIASPQGDVTIPVGASVDFNGMVVNTGLEPLSYLWTFDGAAPDFTDIMPGPVTFSTPGVFVVTFTVTDVTGVSDPNPPSVIVTVTAGEAPSGVILSPTTDITIRQGEAVVFAGSGSSPSGAEPLLYLWDFANGAPLSMEAVPGPVFFQTAGVFEVTLRIFDANGIPDSSPPSVIVTVEPPLGPQPPVGGGAGGGANPGVAVEGEIVSPGGMMVTINVGEAIEFIGSVDTPNPDLWSFEWDFDGAVANVAALSPGFVTFDTEGMYAVTFTATDDQGVSDPTPARVTINVQAAADPAP